MNKSELISQLAKLAEDTRHSYPDVAAIRDALSGVLKEITAERDTHEQRVAELKTLLARANDHLRETGNAHKPLFADITEKLGSTQPHNEPNWKARCEKLEKALRKARGFLPAPANDVVAEIDTLLALNQSPE